MAETDRSKRMIDSAPDYYQYSAVYKAVQEAIAADLNLVETNDEDIRAQHKIITATWGLKYWEESLGIVTVETDGYAIRRSRVLAKWRGTGNFSAALIESVCEAFTNGDVSVTIDIPGQTVTVTFIGVRGVPPNLSDLQAQVDNLVHAHLGLDWAFTYLTFGELDTANKTFEQLTAAGLTFEELATWNPA